MLDAIILARKNSKRLKNKNIKKLNKKRMIDYTFEAALKSNKISRIYCFTDDERIKKFTKNKKILFPLKRPKYLSQDNTKSSKTLLYFVKNLYKKKFISKNFILLQPTSPLRSTKNINSAIKLFEKKKIKYLASFKKDNLKKKSSSFAPDGSIYICNTKDFLKNKKIVPKQAFPIFLNKKFTLDVDTMEDFKKAKKILNVNN